jgi:RNA polymerase sigma factor (TIGR02999 family)
MTADELSRLFGQEGGCNAETLLPHVYAELRRMADLRLGREADGQTLQATALVHEAYLKLVGPYNMGDDRWNSRAHFFSAAAEAMRRILVDRARAKNSMKRGDGVKRSVVELNQLSLDDPPAELLDLDEALTALARSEPLKARLVDLRFFAGLSLEEAAEVLEISVATAGRHWAFARAWLFQRISSGPKIAGS